MRISLLFPVIWAVAGGVWLIESAVRGETGAHRFYDPTGELTDFVVASVCLDLVLAGSGTLHNEEDSFRSNNLQLLSSGQMQGNPNVMVRARFTFFTIFAVFGSESILQ